MTVTPNLPTRLQHHQWLERALWLVDTHFPETSHTYDRVSREDWLNVMYDLYNLVETTDWFAVDWDLLEIARKVWLDHRNCEPNECLTSFLYYLPVKLYGFSDIKARFSFKPLELIYALLSDPDHSEFFECVKGNYELDICWDQTDYEAAWKRLETIDAYPNQYPELVRWLPALAAWTCRCTGNLILLCSQDDPFNRKNRPTWDRDLARVKQAWRQAKPVIEAYQRLAAWCERDKANVTHLVYYLGRGERLDWLDWS